MDIKMDNLHNISEFMHSLPGLTGSYIKTVLLPKIGKLSYIKSFLLKNKKTILIGGFVVLLLFSVVSIISRNKRTTEKKAALTPTPVSEPTAIPVADNFERDPTLNTIGIPMAIEVSGEIGKRGFTYNGIFKTISSKVQTPEPSANPKPKTPIGLFVFEVRDKYNTTIQKTNLETKVQDNGLNAFNTTITLPPDTNSILFSTVQGQILDRVYVSCNLFEYSPCN